MNMQRAHANKLKLNVSLNIVTRMLCANSHTIRIRWVGMCVLCRDINANTTTESQASNYAQGFLSFIKRVQKSFKKLYRIKQREIERDGQRLWEWQRENGSWTRKNRKIKIIFTSDSVLCIIKYSFPQLENPRTHTDTSGWCWMLYLYLFNTWFE